jgi:methylated-DNA-[protein]-cysteine S-methyltransferase
MPNTRGITLTNKDQAPELDATVSWPLGVLGIKMDGNAISRLLFLKEDVAEVRPCNAASKRAADAIKQYLNNPRSISRVSIDLKGTAFQQKVWHALQQLKPGEVVSYGELAKRLGTGARAVGNACRNNPVPVLVPCHRVVAQKSLGGFSGKQSGLMMDIKTWLLSHEGVEIHTNKPH